MTKGPGEDKKGMEQPGVADRVLGVLGDLFAALPEDQLPKIGGLSSGVLARTLKALGENPAAIGEAIAAYLKTILEARKTGELEAYVEADMEDESAGDVFSLNAQLRELEVALTGLEAGPEGQALSPLEAHRLSYQLSQTPLGDRASYALAWTDKKDAAEDIMKGQRQRGSIYQAAEADFEAHTKAIAALALLPESQDIKGALSTRDQLRFQLADLGVGEEQIVVFFKRLQALYGDITDKVPESVIFSVISWVATRNVKVMAIVAAKTHIVDKYLWPILKPIILAVWESRKPKS